MSCSETPNHPTGPKYRSVHAVHSEGGRELQLPCMSEKLTTTASKLLATTLFLPVGSYLMAKRSGRLVSELWLGSELLGSGIWQAHVLQRLQF